MPKITNNESVNTTRITVIRYKSQFRMIFLSKHNSLEIYEHATLLERNTALDIIRITRKYMLRKNKKFKKKNKDFIP